MLADFKKFIMRGNVLDLAVGVIIGGAFATITTSLTEDVIMPVVGAIFGGFDFSSYFLVLGPIPENYSGSRTNYSELKEAGVAMLGFGQFVTVVLNFLFLAFVIFIIVRLANRVMEEFEGEDETTAKPGPTEVQLLREIRDELRKNNANPPA